LSLRNKLFLSSSAIVAVLLSVVLAAVELRVRRQVVSDKLSELERIETALQDHWRNLERELGRHGAIVADAPKLKAAVDTGDPATVEGVARDYQKLIEADHFEVRDRNRELLARFAPAENDAQFLRAAFPLLVGESVLGHLTVGRRLDRAFAERLSRLVDARVVLVRGDRLIASSFSPEQEAELGRAWLALPREGGGGRVTIGHESYLARTGTAEGEPETQWIVLRSLDESLRVLGALRRDLSLLALFATGLAAGASYLTGRTLTRPLAAMVTGMKEMARSGDLTRRIEVRSHDEEAMILASSFNHLTEALLRFRREAEHRERLSSLGRLSATLAHEVRNPLTIIKGSAHHVLEEPSLSTEGREAVEDVLQEVERLDRIVSSVLDSVRPMVFRLEDADINQICRDSLASVVDDEQCRVETRLDLSLGKARVDPARLKQVLLNLLRNAREALRERGRILIETRRDAEVYVIRVSDDGVGIAPEDLPNVFDPFFTRKGTGTGLGLAVARNIVKGLGGEIDIVSSPGRGTEVQLRLPLAPKPVVTPSHAA
jgi:signal transduction histidine kinase